MVLNEYDPATLRRLNTSPGASGKSMSMISFGHRSEHRPMGDIRVPRYATVQVPGDWPDMLVNQATSLPKTIFASIQNRRHYYSGRYFVGYQPAPKGEKDWANHDRWIGPFKSPEGRTITGSAGWGKNRLVLVTRGGMYIVQADEVLRQAEAKGQTCSTQQWRDSIADRLEKTNWRGAVIF